MRTESVPVRLNESIVLARPSYAPVSLAYVCGLPGWLKETEIRDWLSGPSERSARIERMTHRRTDRLMMHGDYVVCFCER